LPEFLMTDHSVADVTTLLRAWGAGDERALEQLAPLVDADLRRIAQRLLQHERGAHTYQTTALLNEMYLRLLPAPPVDWQDRAHFFNLAARLMRRLLVEHARQQHAAKRGGLARRVTLEEALAQADDRAPDVTEIVAVDEALARFAAEFPRQARVVELRYFLGMTVNETAEALQVNPTTVTRQWNFARVWLRHQLAANHSGDNHEPND
jgi:RNA polymerase sigma factor (TIGR02999 family)